jgi:hypothetical protein
MSCLFNSLSYFFKEDSFIIRQKICDYLQENKPIIEGMDTHQVIAFESNVDRYIQTMRYRSTWGGAIEIQCACNIWNVQINVSNYRDNNNKIIEFVPITKQTNNCIHIYWTGGHFEPIRK